MRYQILVLFAAFFSVSIFSQTVSAYASCDGYQLNTSLLSSPVISGICYWQGGDLYLSWSHGEGSGFSYSVQTYNNSNATVYINGGGTNFTLHSPCITNMPSKYYPQGDYQFKIQTQGQAVNGSCYKAFLRFGTTLPKPSTTTTTRQTTVVTTVYTSTIYQQSSTTLNITISPSTPLVALSAARIYTNGSTIITARTVSGSDAVEILINGESVASGLGSVSYTASNLSAGNYYVQGYDVSQRVYSQQLTLQVVPTTTSSTTSIATTIPVTSSTISTSSIIQTNQTNNTSSGGNGGSVPLWEIVIPIIIIAAIIAYLYNRNPNTTRAKQPPAAPEEN